MKNFKLPFYLLLVLTPLLMIACSEDQNLATNESPLDINPTIESQFNQLGFDTQYLKVETPDNPFDALSEPVYILQNDLQISEGELQDMLKRLEAPPLGEQFRSGEIVKGAPRIINVTGYYSPKTSNPYFLDSKMRTALQGAIAELNGLGTGLTFNLSFGTDTASPDIVVYRVTGGSGAQSGLPSNGDPYKWISIQSGTSAFSTAVVELTITHQFGHSIGLQHTDHFDRSISCGGSPGSPNPNAFHIPGTPDTVNIDMNSVMLTCFLNSANSGFSYFDSVALKVLYP